MGTQLKIYKKKAIPSSPTTADDGIYYIQSGENSADTVIISDGKVYKAAPGLQQVTDNGNTTTNDMILNTATLGADENGNIKFGIDALNNKTDATQNNIAIGANTLTKSVEAPELIAIGNNALREYIGTKTDDWIISIGPDSTAKLKKGVNSVFIGGWSGRELDSVCKYNTFVGANTGVVAKEAESTILLGQGAAYRALKLSDDIAIGHMPLGSYLGENYINENHTSKPTMTSGGNIVIGKYAGYRVMCGRENIFVGDRCGYDFRNYGEYNTFLGSNIAKGYNHIFGDTNVVIGAYTPLTKKSKGFYNKLVIHAQRPEDTNTDPLVYGDFKEKWFQINGKYILNYKYTPDANKELVEGETPFVPTKMLVSDNDGNVGVKDIELNNLCIIDVKDGKVDMSDPLKKSFQEVLGISDTGWTDVTFQNGTSNYGSEYPPVQYRKVGNRIFVQGLIKGGTSQNNGGSYILFNLPVNFRPKYRHIFSTIANGILGRIVVYPNGDVMGVVYRSEWTSMEFNYFLD